MYSLWIGIDPGEHTGFAVWDGRRLVEVATYKLHEAFDRVQFYRGQGTVAVIFEDARLRRWFAPERNASEYRGKLMGAGAAKRDAKIWEEYLSDIGVPYEAHKPQAGGTKWSAERFAAVTGYKGRTSEHSRDAALLVYGR